MLLRACCGNWVLVNLQLDGVIRNTGHARITPMIQCLICYSIISNYDVDDKWIGMNLVGPDFTWHWFSKFMDWIGELVIACEFDRAIK